MKIDREEQKAQEPSKRTGDGQDSRVPTHEGSQLDAPTTAGDTTSNMPSDKEAQ